MMVPVSVASVTDRKNYASIDVMKFIMSLAVIAIHTRAALDTTFSQPVTFLINLAVPFFFMASGFLIYTHYRKSASQSVARYYFSRSLRFIRLFVIWAIIYFPLAILYYASTDSSWLHDLVSYVRRFITSGDLPYAWPLWYLHAMALALLLIAAMRKMGLDTVVVWCIGLLLLLIAFFYDRTPLEAIPDPMNAMAVNYNRMFNTTRNGIFWGVAYVSTGMMIGKYGHRVHPLVVGTVMFVLGYLLLAQFLPFSELCGAAGVLLFCKGVDERYNPKCAWPLRSMSSIIYFTHMFFVVILMRHPAALQYVRYSPFLTWLGLCLLTIALSVGIVRLMRNSRFAWLKQIF